jgi:hypothetical protein
MSNTNDGFQEVVNKKNPMWDCCTMKNADGETIPREKTDKSFMVGYYLGMEIRTGKNSKEFTIHNFKLKTVGDTEHLSEAVEPGGDVSCWGKTTLDEMLTKNVPIGTLCKIVWEGKVASKANAGQKYHVFKVFVNANETLSGADLPTAKEEVKTAPAPQQMATATANASSDLDDDDDMPF